MPAKTVFLSSTFNELREFRSAARDAIEATPADAQLQAFHCIGMENFPSADATPAAFVRSLIQNCDVFICLVGHGYGSCAPEDALSYTEFEYQAALDLGKPVYVFMSADDTAVGAQYRESDDLHERQLAFRNLVKRRMKAEFHDAVELRVGISEVLSALRSKQQLPIQMPDIVHPYLLQANFTGRNAERRALTEWFLADTRPVLVIEALGGMGKSALAWVWLRRDVLGVNVPGVRDSGAVLPPDRRPQGILWWSFYEQDAQFDAFLDRALLYTDGAPPESGTSSTDKVRRLVHILEQGSFLFVLDGFERELRAYGGLGAAYAADDVSQDSRLRSCSNPVASRFLEFLIGFSPSSRVLITTRLLPEELAGSPACKLEQLEALTPEDAVEFMRSQKITGTRQDIEGACEHYGFHPLALRLLAGVLVKDPKSPCDIRRAPAYAAGISLVQKKNHILGLAYQRAGSSARQLLNLISAFRFAVPYKAIEVVYEPRRRPLRFWNPVATPEEKERELASDLRELSDRGLLFFDHERRLYDLHPIVRNYAFNQLGDNRRAVARKLVDYFKAVPEPVRIDKLEQLTPTIGCFYHLVQAEEFAEAFYLFADRLQEPLLQRFCAVRLYTELLEELLPDEADNAARLATLFNKELALKWRAQCFYLSGKPRRAVQMYETAVRLLADRQPDEERSLLHINIALATLQLGEFGNTEQHLKTALEVSQAAGNPPCEHFARDLLARLAVYDGRYEAAKDELSRMDKDSTESFERILTRTLAARFQGETAGALESARRAVTAAEARGDRMAGIRGRSLLATCLLDTAESTPNHKGALLAEASRLLSETLPKCRELNFIDMEADLLISTARLHLANRDVTEASRFAEQAMDIASQSEYLLKSAEICLLRAAVAKSLGAPAQVREWTQRARDLALQPGPRHQYQWVLAEAEQAEKQPQRSATA